MTSGCSSVLGVAGQLTQTTATVYDEARVFARSAVIAVAIDARRQHYLDETPYVYQPFAGLEDDYRFSPDAYQRVIKNYNLLDLGI